jgi:hypothetical protein
MKIVRGLVKLKELGKVLGIGKSRKFGQIKRIEENQGNLGKVAKIGGKTYQV